jgi:membrane protein
MTGERRPANERRADDQQPAAAGRDVPQKLAEMPTSSWRQILRRATKQIGADNLTDRAAALTYYGVLAMFPALLVLVSSLGLLGHTTTQSLVDNLGAIAPGAVRSFFQNVINDAQSRRGAAGLAAAIGLVLAVWSASAYVSAFMRASNAIYSIAEGRPIWKTAPVRVGVTVATLVGLVAGAVIIVVTGSVANQVGKVFGLGHTAVTVWDIAKWPVLLVVLMLMLALLYWACPNVKQPRFRWITPGSALAIIIWLLASGGFAVYVANFASYNKTYGSLAGVIIFLIWLWISNLAILLGAELNAQIEHERAIQAGLPADAEPFVVPRDTRRLDDHATARAEHTSHIRED